jgi:hypothetical protein
MRTPFDLIQALRAWFFSRDGDVVLQSGRKIAVSSANIEISNGNLTITTGNITITGTVDGVDISAHAANSDAHHNRSHALDSGSDHTGTLPWNDLNKTGSDLADLATRAHSSLTGVTADQHHNEAHTVASHSDTTATGSELNTLTDGSDASTLHDHDGRYYQESEFSSYPSNEKPLKSTSSGGLNLGQNLAADGVILAGDDIKAGGGLISGSSTANVPTGILILKEVASVGTPSSTFGGIYFKSSDSRLYYKNDAGTEYGPL